MRCFFISLRLGLFRRLELIQFRWRVSELTLLSPCPSPRLTLFPSFSQRPSYHLYTPQAIVIRRDRIRHPRWVRIRVDNPNGRDVVQATLMQQHPILQRIQADHQIRLQRRSIQ